MNLMRTPLSLAALTTSLFVASPALATPALPFTVNCKTMNAANIGVTADANGYTSIYPFTHGPDFDWQTYYGSGSMDTPLPANGIICLRSFKGQPSAYYSYLRFVRNAGNTPVYFIVETTIDMGYSWLQASGTTASDFFSAGLTDKGGLGGPGGSDGGSCDYSVATSKRSGEGLGPGGGYAANTTYKGGGGGAGPTRSGGAGYNQSGGASAGALGGTALSAFDHRILHGGSGGGCGDMAGTAYSGGGGGGVLVVVAGTSIQTGYNSNAGFAAMGGASNSGGGGGGGGMVRLISPKIFGDGFVDVRGSATALGFGAYTSNPSCNNTSNYGGCGGHGLVKLEGYDVAGNFVQYTHRANGRDSVKFGAPQTPVLAAANIPRVEVTKVTATFDGSTEEQIPPAVDFTDHPYVHPGMYFRSEQVVTVTVLTKHVPNSSVVKVRMNAMNPANATSVVVNAGSPVAGANGSYEYTWTATLTVPTDAKIGSIEAWVASVCTPGTLGCNTAYP